MGPFNKHLLYLYYNLRTVVDVGDSKINKIYEIHSLTLRKKVKDLDDT